jgi:NAD(P)-dependent dehydrogenase (short-subunit alcohol dehydrogenase family)
MDLAGDLKNKRVLITQAADMMGPAIAEVFRNLGAEVITDTSTLEDPTYPSTLVKRTGRVDILIIGAGVEALGEETRLISDDHWKRAFEYTVDPVLRLVQAVLPQMTLRKSGKIILIGSAAGLKGIKNHTVYCAVRGAQLSYIQALGVELAEKNIQVNAIAQNFVDTAMYFPDSVRNSEEIQYALKHQVPLGRMISPNESAQFVAYLASSYANCFVGQIFPLAGGWVTR